MLNKQEHLFTSKHGGFSAISKNKRIDFICQNRNLSIYKTTDGRDVKWLREFPSFGKDFFECNASVQGSNVISGARTANDQVALGESEINDRVEKSKAAFLKMFKRYEELKDTVTVNGVVNPEADKLLIEEFESLTIELGFN